MLQGRQGIPSSELVITVWVDLQPSTTFTSRLVFRISRHHIFVNYTTAIALILQYPSASLVLIFCSLGILLKSTVSSWKGNHREAHNPCQWCEHCSAGGLSSEWFCVRRWGKSLVFVRCGCESLHLLAREQQTFQCPYLWIWQQSFPPTTGIGMQPQLLKFWILKQYS